MSKGIEILPSPRRVRAEIDGTTVADSSSALLCREERRAPVYYFPQSDVRFDLMDPSKRQTNDPTKGDAQFWTLRLGYRVVEDVAWVYENPSPPAAALRGYAALDWGKVDHWYEEAAEIFLHPRDPRRRVDVVASHRSVEVELGGEIIARSDRPMFLFETRAQTRYYLPPSDVRMELLSPTPSTSVCPYKGTASYFTAQIGEQHHKDIAWTYADPIPECPRIKGLICFYNEQVDAVRIDGELISADRPNIDWR